MNETLKAFHAGEVLHPYAVICGICLKEVFYFGNKSDLSWSLNDYGWKKVRGTGWVCEYCAKAEIEDA